MDLSKKYRDTNDNDCNILQMIEREPEWAANRIQSGEKLLGLETTVRTFLHDLDDADGRDLKIIMTNAMWLQVQAFRNLLA